MAIDISGILMGDPGSTPRRAPTEREMQAATHYANTNRAGPNDGRVKRALAKYSTIQVGETVNRLTKRQALNAYRWMHEHGRYCSVRRHGDGSFQVTRLR